VNTNTGASSNAAESNLRVIPYLLETYDYPIGYSGHEVWLQVSYAAVALGAQLIER
jgi:N-acetylneuraminate synthase